MKERTRRRDDPIETTGERARVLRELTEDPGAPPLDQLTEFVRVVHLRLFGVARDREQPIGERLGAATQLGREALAAGDEDPKGVRPEVQQLLHALRGYETSSPDSESPLMLEAVEQALQYC
jgi:hypothetical protein